MPSADPIHTMSLMQQRPVGLLVEHVSSSKEWFGNDEYDEVAALQHLCEPAQVRTGAEQGQNSEAESSTSSSRSSSRSSSIDDRHYQTPGVSITILPLGAKRR